MKQIKLGLGLWLCLLAYALPTQAAPHDTLFVADYGVHPDTREDQTARLQQVIADAKRWKSRVMVFQSGRYDLWPTEATRKEYYISNTSSETECPSKVKTIGLFLEDMEGLTIEGNDATLMFHGKMTMLTLAHCHNMRLQNIHFDFERPGGSELTYLKVDAQGVTTRVHPDSRYIIVNGRMSWVGEGWRTNYPHCIEYNPETHHFEYSKGWEILSQAKATELSPNVVHFATQYGRDFQPNHTITVRDIIRDQVGMFLFESQNITIRNIGVHYMNGLGIVSQYCRNVTMHQVQCAPREGSTRLLASSADFMHFSGCSGKISIDSCRFVGAQDDPINVHGTNLRAVERVDDYTLHLRFMHPQSYGFQAFFAGDTLAFVQASTMLRYAENVVKTARLLSPRIMEVTFLRPIPKTLQLQSDCVENLTCTPEVEISHCYFSRTSTRGTLVTTPRRVIIRNNTYDYTGMSAILIEGDASGWYESGPVKDVLIEGNRFVGCAYNGHPSHAVIALNPSNTVVDARHPVHQNVRIINNHFVTFGNPLLYAKSTSDLVFKGNRVEVHPSASETGSKWFILDGCSDVVIKGNRFPVPFTLRTIQFANMKPRLAK